jgi:hypothetical protein
MDEIFEEMLDNKGYVHHLFNNGPNLGGFPVLLVSSPDVRM